MPFTSEKIDILTEVKILKGGVETSPKTRELATSLQSIKENQKIKDFLFDVLMVLVGGGGLNKVLGEVIKKVLKNGEDKIKRALFSKSFIPDSNKALPSSLVNGIEIPLKKMDKKKQFKYSPDSLQGKKLYSTNIDSLDKKIYESINTNGVVDYKSTLKLKFDNTTQNVKVTPSDTTTKANAFIEKYIKNIDIFDEETITKNILNKIFRTDNEVEKSEVEKEEEIVIDNLVKQVIDADSDGIDELVLEEIDTTSIISEKIIDIGCGYIELSVTEEEYDTILTGVTTNQSNDVIATLFNDALNKNLSNDIVNDENKETEARAGFFKKIIQEVQNSVVGNLVKSPDLQIYMNMVNTIKSGTTSTFKDSKDLVKENVSMVKSISDSMECIINEVISNILEEEINKLSKALLERLKREKINIYKKIIKSLLNK